MSLAMIGAVSALVVGATGAFFSDTETSTGNTFTAGTIDIDINDQNPWTDNFDLGDVKPGEVAYMNFKIGNVGENPVNVSKKLYNFMYTDIGEEYACEGAENTSSEPECEAEEGTPVDDVESQILYDLSVEVYDASGNKTWWQTIYEVDGEGDVNLYDVYGNNDDVYIALGMIPVDGYMMVTQSYHFDENAGNEYQGDGLTFDMEILGEQLTGVDGKTVVTLENKSYSNGEWVINSGDNIEGVLEYKANASEFEYTVSGVAPAEGAYVLAIGYDAGTNVDTFVADVITDTSGAFSVSGSIDLGEDMMGVKAWLVPAEYWNASTEQVMWSNWDSMVGEFLWETSFVWYNDTDAS